MRRVRFTSSVLAPGNPEASASHAEYRFGSATCSPSLAASSKSAIAICEPKPAARRTAYRTSYAPPLERLRSPSSGSGSRRLAMGGT
ncbi:MAG: hypothetical protein LC620_07065, partial [Halobacteriales archaeon]|nr:hypothetical protein [Halobacteriales archaeon]